MPNFRCYGASCTELPGGRLGFDFTADKPICPKCKCNGDDPLFADMVIRLATIHFMVADAQGPIVTPQQGRRRIVCAPSQPDVGEGHPNFQHVTGDASCVTCDACKATAIFGKAVSVDDGAAKTAVKGQKLAALPVDIKTIGAKTNGN